MTTVASPHLDAVVTALWTSALGGRHPGTADFFDAGGTLMAGYRLIERVNAELGTSFSVSALFAHRTLAEFRGLIAGEGQDRVRRRRVAVGDLGEQPTFVYVPGCYGEDFHCHRLLAELGRGTYWLRGEGLDLPVRPPERMSDVAAGYAGLLTGTPDTGRLVLLGYSVGGLAAWLMAGMLRDQGREVAAVVLLDTFPSPPLTVRPAAAIRYFRRREVRRTLDRIGRRSGLVPPGGADPDAADVADFLSRTGVLPPGLDVSQFYRRIDVFATLMVAGHGVGQPDWDGPVLHVRSTAAAAAGVRWSKPDGAPVPVIDLDLGHSRVATAPQAGRRLRAELPYLRVVTRS